MDKIKSIIDGINEFIGKTISWFTLFLVLVVVYDVIVRYLFKTSSVALQEIEWHFFSIIFLGAAAFTYKYDDHVRVDIFYTRFSERGKAILNLIGDIVLLIPFCLIMIFISEDFVVRSFTGNETSPDPGGLPARFIIKAFVPFSFFLLLLQAFSSVIKSYLLLRNLSSGNSDA